MKQAPFHPPCSAAALRNSILNGEWGPSPETLPVTGASAIYQTTQFPSSGIKYHNYYLLLRSEAYFGACSYTADQLDIEIAGQLSGLSLDVVLRDPRTPVKVAAMDAYLGVVRPHSEHCSKTVEIQTGTPIQKARQRDALIAQMAGIQPKQSVALIGVVNPLIEAIQTRGGICLPCDLQLDITQQGEAVEKDMEKVLDRADHVICTAMTLGNGTFDRVLARARERQIPLTVYAQTGSAVIAPFIDNGVTALVAEPFPFTQFNAGPSTLYCYLSEGEERADES
ncbi:Rossmann-like domain-containing protein [Cohnella sp. GCM10020058]|uniref:Rossmann-like domain-containing protein n=1 Tax=Cohnella sp. GCM10020058 TaxID=3317330 RepID=UPI003630AE12